MAEGVLMPKAGITVESCIISAWKKKVGDPVKVGDILFTYETDKAEFECESTVEGTLLDIFYKDGDEVPCLVNVCAVGASGEDVSALRGGSTTPSQAEKPVAAPSAPATPAPKAAPTGPVAQAVIMPKAGITVESCIISAWKKQVGDMVKAGDILFTYETDKAEFECESTADGKLLAVFFKDGDEVPCLENVCAIGRDGDDVDSLRPGSAAAMPAQAAPAAVSAPTAAEVPVPTEAAAISPRARNLAERSGVHAAFADATGPKGRVIERDVRRLMEEGKTEAVSAPVAALAPVAAAPTASAAAAASIAAPAAEADYEDVKFNQVRKVTAKTMMKSLSTMAQLTQQYSFDATQIQTYRKMLKTIDGPMGKISLNDMVMFAVSRTVQSFPDLNANMLDDTTVRRFKHVNLGFACDTPRGLLVPVIFKADEMGLLELSMEAKRLAEEAKGGQINPDYLSGGSFTVSNIGSMGCEAFTPVINPPQTGILGVCNIQTKIKSAQDGVIVTYPAMGLSLTFDHRALDGAPAARFMSELCKNLESFMSLLAR
ncbi:MAG: 2-oxo acid dehydrogenase subunit E2 [Oscillospiraceae bacterium]|nr:2-oxo acid dehydrogenase subunit E2 [Oscillospiraceae bacterium]